MCDRTCCVCMASLEIAATRGDKIPTGRGPEGEIPEWCLDIGDGEITVHDQDPSQQNSSGQNPSR